MSQLSDADVARLRKLAGMLGSEHDGEVLAAARKATAFLTERKMTWADVIGARGPVSSGNPFTGNPFADQYRYDMSKASARGEEAMRAAARDFSDSMAHFTASMQEAMRTVKDTLSTERAKVVEARLALDMILKREKLDPKKREHFESIRSYHRVSGYINPAHRAQILREFYKNGWDAPLDGGAKPDPNERINIKTDADGRRYVTDKDGVRQYLGSLEE